MQAELKRASRQKRTQQWRKNQGCQLLKSWQPAFKLATFFKFSYLSLMELPPGIHIKENSLVAKLAALKLRSRTMAIVFGKTIHLHGVSKQRFLQNTNWVKHELMHVQQYKQHGYFLFLCKYLIESLKNGYEKNRFEVEAREAESKCENDTI